MINQNINNHPKLNGYNDEIKKCLENKLFSQVTSTSRQALEYMVTQYITEYNQSLNLCNTVNEKINGLKASGIINEDWVKNSSIIRRIANDGGAHDNTSSSGHVINEQEAINVFDTLLKLENDFLEKMPSVSVKDIQEGFKNKRYEKDELLQIIESNDYFFNASCHNSKNGHTWYTFNFKVKKIAYKYKYIYPNHPNIKYCGEDGGYYIFEYNGQKEQTSLLLESDMYKRINIYNAMTDEEIEIRYQEYLKQQSIKEQENKKRMQEQYELSSIKYREEYNKRKKEEEKKKLKKYMILAIIIITILVFITYKQTKKINEEKQKIQIQQKEKREKENENYIKQIENDKLIEELISETLEFDINYVKGNSIYNSGDNPVTLSNSQCAGNGAYLEWVEDGERKYERKLFYFKPTEILYDDDAINFIKRLEPLFLNNFVEDGLYNGTKTLNTEKYYYCVIKFSVNDSEYIKYLGEGTEIEAADMSTYSIKSRDEKNWKTVDQKYYSEAFYYKVLKKHKLGDGVYPIYAILKFEKDYTNYNFAYDMSLPYPFDGWFPHYYKVEVYKHYE